MRAVITIIILIVWTNAFAQMPEHGTIRQSPGGESQVWDSGINDWTGVELFWIRYAEGNGGLTWGKTRTYPEYRDVREHHIILIELDQGVCLMEFYHTRWRRANDVRRWDAAFNEYGGCPYVFD